MMNQKLKQSLEELYAELKEMGSEDPKLLKLAEDVQRALGEDDDELPLVDSLRDATDNFEAKHPQLTAIINNVMNSLSNIGI